MVCLLWACKHSTDHTVSRNVVVLFISYSTKKAAFPVIDKLLGNYDNGAANETRTRDPDLGKVVLYQLSYCRR